MAIAVFRLQSLSSALKSSDFLFAYASTVVYTQAELCFNIICATLPCFNLILQAANTGLLSESVGRTTKTTHSSSGRRTATSKSEPVELTSRGYGKYTAGVSGGSIASENSRTAIVDNHTVSVLKES